MFPSSLCTFFFHFILWDDDDVRVFKISCSVACKAKSYMYAFNDCWCGLHDLCIEWNFKRLLLHIRMEAQRQWKNSIHFLLFHFCVLVFLLIFLLFSYCICIAYTYFFIWNSKKISTLRELIWWYWNCIIP